MPLDGVEYPMAVRVVDHVVEIGDPLLFDEIAQDIHVAVGLGVRGENVMVRDDDHLVAVPDLGVLAEFALENADGARAADVVRHQHIGVDPNIISGLHAGLAGGAGQDFFSQSHKFTAGSSQFASTMRLALGTVEANIPCP